MFCSLLNHDAKFHENMRIMGTNLLSEMARLRQMLQWSLAFSKSIVWSQPIVLP